MLSIHPSSENGVPAGDIQAAIEGGIEATEHAPSFLERADGAFDVQFRIETSDEMFGRLAAENNIGEAAARALFPGEQPGRQIKTGLTKRPGQVIEISPALLNADGSPLTLADFPDGWNFGNGVTCNALVELKDGTMRRLSWAVFPDAAAVSVRAQLPALRAIIEAP